MLDPFLVMVVDGEVQADIGPVGVMLSWRSGDPMQAQDSLAPLSYYGCNHREGVP